MGAIQVGIRCENLSRKWKVADVIEFYTLQYGKKALEEYGAEMNKLMRFLPKDMKANEKAKISKLVTGLDAKI